MILIPVSIFAVLSLIGISNLKSGVSCLLFLIMAIPLGQLFPYLNTVGLLRIGSVSVYELLIIFYLLLVVFKGKFRYSRFSLFSLIFIAFYICDAVFSSGKYGMYSVLADAKDYVVAMLLVQLIIQVVDYYTIDDFGLIVLKGTFVASIITFIGYIGTYHTILPVASRYGFGIQTLFLFSIPYGLYLIIVEKKNELWIALEILLQCYLIVLSQNRTNPVIIAFIVLIGIWYYLTSDIEMPDGAKKRLRNWIFIIICILGACVIYIKINSSVTTGFIGRINEVLLSNGETDSMKVRNINIAYYLSEIMKNSMGVGLGAYMPAKSIYASGFDDSTFLNYGFDNMFITMSYKVGIAVTIVYAVYLLWGISIVFRKRKIERASFLCGLILIGLVIAGGVYTGQLLKNISIYTCFMATLTILTCKSREAIE